MISIILAVAALASLVDRPFPAQRLDCKGWTARLRPESLAFRPKRRSVSPRALVAGYLTSIGMVFGSALTSASNGVLAADSHCWGMFVVACGGPADSPGVCGPPPP